MLLHTTADKLYRSSDSGFMWVEITHDLEPKYFYTKDKELEHEYLFAEDCADLYFFPFVPC